MCWGCVRGYFQSDKGLYCDVIFLCGAGCQIFTSHPVLFAPTICKLSSIFSRRNKSTRDFVPRFRRLETRSLSHFRSRLVASLTKLWLLFDTYMYLWQFITDEGRWYVSLPGRGGESACMHLFHFHNLSDMFS